MPRNIVICCDGTTNEVANDSTNVLRIYRTLERNSQQLAYYDAGVGTVADPAAITEGGKLLSKRLDSAIGHSVRENAVKAYRFLATHYLPGDKVFLFGFSRGAYTAKAIAGMIHFLGLVRPELEGLAPLGWAIYSDEDRSLEVTRRFAGGARFKRCFSVEAETRIHFVGLWDTVSSFGWFWNYRTLPHTANNPSIDHIRHALAIDERRVAFRANLFRPQSTGQHRSIKQVWFAGAHCDVGGGNPEEGDSLAKITLQWMLRESEREGLLVNSIERDELLSGPDRSHPDALGPINESLNGWWGILEFIPRRVFNIDTKSMMWKWPNLGGRRTIALDPPELCTALHESVVTRIKAPDAHYHPPNVPAELPIER